MNRIIAGSIVSEQFGQPIRLRRQPLCILREPLNHIEHIHLLIPHKVGEENDVLGAGAAPFGPGMRRLEIPSEERGWKKLKSRMDFDLPPAKKTNCFKIL